MARLPVSIEPTANPNQRPTGSRFRHCCGLCKPGGFCRRLFSLRVWWNRITASVDKLVNRASVTRFAVLEALVSLYLATLYVVFSASLGRVVAPPPAGHTTDEVADDNPSVFYANLPRVLAFCCLIRLCSAILGALAAWGRKVQRTRLYWFLMFINVVLGMFVIWPLAFTTCTCEEVSDLNSNWEALRQCRFPEQVNVLFTSPPDTCKNCCDEPEPEDPTFLRQLPEDPTLLRQLEVPSGAISSSFLPHRRLTAREESLRGRAARTAREEFLRGRAAWTTRQENNPETVIENVSNMALNVMESLVAPLILSRKIDRVTSCSIPKRIKAKDEQLAYLRVLTEIRCQSFTLFNFYDPDIFAKYESAFLYAQDTWADCIANVNCSSLEIVVKAVEGDSGTELEIEACGYSLADTKGQRQVPILDDTISKNPSSTDDTDFAREFRCNRTAFESVQSVSDSCDRSTGQNPWHPLAEDPVFTLAEDCIPFTFWSWRQNVEKCEECVAPPTLAPTPAGPPPTPAPVIPVLKLNEEGTFCNLIVTLSLILFFILTLVALPMLIVVFLYIERHCGDEFITTNQFDVSLSQSMSSQDFSEDGDYDRDGSWQTGAESRSNRLPQDDSMLTGITDAQSRRTLGSESQAPRGRGRAQRSTRTQQRQRPSKSYASRASRRTEGEEGISDEDWLCDSGVTLASWRPGGGGRRRSTSLPNLHER